MPQPTKTIPITFSYRLTHAGLLGLIPFIVMSTQGSTTTFFPTPCIQPNPPIPPGYLPFRADSNGDRRIDRLDLFEVSLNWNTGLVGRGYRAEQEYLLEVLTAHNRTRGGKGMGDANLDGRIDNDDLDLFYLLEEMGLTDCGCGITSNPRFPFTMDMNGDGALTSTDTEAFFCVLGFGGTCTPTPSPTPSATPSSTATPTSTSTLTNTPTPTPTPTCGVVSFPDSALDREVRIELNIPSAPLTTCDLNRLEVLNLADKGIRNIDGLEFAVNLERTEPFRESYRKCFSHFSTPASPRTAP